MAPRWANCSSTAASTAASLRRQTLNLTEE